MQLKKLTLELYEKIIDAVYDKSLSNLNMLGHVTRSECADYIGFYALHGGLFWSEQNGKIVGVSTAHPGKRNIDWTWDGPPGIWTAHLVWADNTQAHAEVLRQFLQSRQDPVNELWTWRKHKLVALTREKLERILSYGRRRNNNSGTKSSRVRGVDAGRSEGSGGDGARGVRSGSNLPTKVCPASGADSGLPRGASTCPSGKDVPAGCPD
jgi:hypothetical protein